MPCKANSHGQKSGLRTWSSKPSKSGGFPFCIEGNCDLGHIICSSVSRFVFISIVGSFKAISFTNMLGHLLWLPSALAVLPVTEV